MKREVVLCVGDDWEGLFVDGRLIYEDHSISTKYVANIITGNQPCSFEEKEVDMDWLYEIGTFPENIIDVKFNEEIE